MAFNNAILPQTSNEYNLFDYIHLCTYDNYLVLWQLFIHFNGKLDAICGVFILAYHFQVVHRL